MNLLDLPLMETCDLAAALEHQPAVRQAMAEPQGRDRATQLTAGLQQEQLVKQNPVLQTERVVKTWMHWC